MILQRIRASSGEYPRQFWLLFWGMLISASGSSMVWPFLMIYVSERLTLPLTAVASLMSLNAVMGLLFSFIAGPVTDRFGRKWVMVISLAGNGLGYLLLSRAANFPEFAVLMAMQGAFNPLYRVGSDAMLADLVEPDRRVDAYSLLRLSNNVGVAFGPAVGGFLASRSYAITFLLGAVGLLTFATLIFLQARETMPQPVASQRTPERLGGYDRIFHDTRFILFVLAFTLTQVGVAILWVLLAVYTKLNFGLSESLYGLIPTTNALMVVFFQVLVTRVTKRYPPLWVMGTGALFYAVGVGSVALGHSFWGFWMSMVIATIGELTMVPTGSTYAANSAPIEMRGRYMSIYGLTWGLAMGIGPVLGGALSDNIGPQAPWIGAFVIGMGSVAFFVTLARRYHAGQVVKGEPADPAG